MNIEVIFLLINFQIGLENRNHREMENLFKLVGFDAFEQWYENPRGTQVFTQPEYTDKAQMIDPMVGFYTEVEQPYKLRQYVKKWRTGAEMRFKMPYYPDTKEPSRTFSYL